MITNNHLALKASQTINYCYICHNMAQFCPIPIYVFKVICIYMTFHIFQPKTVLEDKNRNRLTENTYANVPTSQPHGAYTFSLSGCFSDY